MTSLKDRIAKAKLRHQSDIGINANGFSDTASADFVSAGTVKAPLSPMQKRLWFLDQLNPKASIAYHIGTSIRLDGPLNVPVLKRSLSQLAERHAALRTTFCEHDGDVFQTVSQIDGSFKLLEKEVSGETLSAELLIELQKPIDLLVGPLVRGVLYSLGPETHVLQLIQHHIVSDGWSVGVLVQDLCAIYEALLEDRVPSLPPITNGYADFVEWRAQADDKAKLDYWVNQLRSAPPLLDLPKDRPRPSEQSFRGGIVRARLDMAETQAVLGLAKRHKSTPFMVLLSLWGLLLQRLSGQDDIVVGVPSANRSDASMVNVVGFFANSVPVRITTTPSTTVPTLIASVYETIMDAFDNEGVPFEEIVKELNPARIVGANPIFQTMFSLEDGLDTRPQKMGTAFLSSEPLDRTTADFELSADLAIKNGELEIAVNYSRDLFERSTAQRYLDHFLELIRSAVLLPDADVKSLNLLSAADQKMIVDGFNQTSQGFEGELPAHLQIEAIAASAPNSVAVIDSTCSLTFADLAERSDQVAHQLLKAGLKTGERVGLHLQRNHDLIVAIIGVMKAGGVYVPLDPEYPPERLQYFVEDCRPVAVISNAENASFGPDTGCPILGMSYDKDADFAHALPTFSPTSTDPAYLIYTSGSTGKPKGVVISHGNLKNLVCGQKQRFGLGPQDRVLQFSSQNFDTSVEEIFCGLCAGAALVMRPNEVMVPDHTFLDLLEDNKVTMVNLPTAFWERWAQNIHAGRAKPAYVPRIVAVGGEAIHSHSVRNWFAEPACQNSVWLNVYGPTEATVSATMMQIDVDRDLAFETVPIGSPITNYSIYILDEAMAPVPIGVVGEMYIGGDGVALGYFERPDTTEERFLPDTFSARDGARMYRTGDQASWRADGTLTYEGRNDSQIKIRGVRIELTEVEAALNQCAGIEESVAVSRVVDEEKLLVAYVKTDPDLNLSGSAVRRELGQRLPKVMVPSIIVPVETFAMTPNGKIDRNHLPKADPKTMIDTVVTPPKGTTEKLIAGIWQKILNIEEVDRHSDFFDIGGHSLLGVKMMHQLSEALGRQIPVKQLFSATTVSELAAAVTGNTSQSLMISFKSEATGAPLFMIHAGDGDVSYARGIAKNLSHSRPCFALAAQGLNASETPHTDIAQMARSYLDEIRGAQPFGPYHLAGWSAGGSIALELARLFEEAGEKVAYLGMIDTRATYDDPSADYSLSDYAESDAELLDLCRYWRLDGMAFDPLQAGVKSPITSQKLLTCLSDMDAADGIESPEELIQHMRVRRAIAKALVSYSPPKLHVSPCLYAAARDGAELALLGWDQRLDGCSTPQLFDATHFSIVQSPCVEMLATAMDADIFAASPQMAPTGLNTDAE